MKSISKPRINLATHPQRNTRFFTILFILLVSLFLLVLSGSAWTFFKFRNKAVSTASSIRSMQNEITTIKEDEKRLKALIENEKASKMSQVELLNSIIYKKSFSWIGFLAHLEELLPESCYVLSLDPVLNNGKKMRVNLKVASPSLNDLLELVSRLDNQGFGEIRVHNETTLENGSLTWDLSYNYENEL